MENSEELKALIRKNADLFWYIKDEEKENLEFGVVLEFFLNYASLADVKELFRIVGIEKAAEEFHRQVGKSERASKNYNIVSKNYYINYFKRHAS